MITCHFHKYLLYDREINKYDYRTTVLCRKTLLLNFNVLHVCADNLTLHHFAIAILNLQLTC